MTQQSLPDDDQQPAGSEPQALQPVAADGFSWRYSDSAGVAADGPAVAFADQQAAETWLAENFQTLADDGITAVSLFDGESIVYGPMPLDPA